MNSTPPRALRTTASVLRRGLPDVAADEVGAGDLDERAARQHSESRVDLADQPGDGRLARSRVPGEDEVARDGRRRHSPFLAEARNSVEADDLVDLGLYRGQAREPVELGDQLLEARQRSESVDESREGAGSAARWIIVVVGTAPSMAALEVRAGPTPLPVAALISARRLWESAYKSFDVVCALNSSVARAIGRRSRIASTASSAPRLIWPTYRA